MSPKTGKTWRLCDWNTVCQMPVRHADVSVADGAEVFCRWHRWCANAPVLANDRVAFAEFMMWIRTAYPGDEKGWWGWPDDALWPVVQGVEQVWDSQPVATGPSSI